MFLRASSDTGPLFLRASTNLALVSSEAVLPVCALAILSLVACETILPLCIATSLAVFSGALFLAAADILARASAVRVFPVLAFDILSRVATVHFLPSLEADIFAKTSGRNVVRASPPIVKLYPCGAVLLKKLIQNASLLFRLVLSSAVSITIKQKFSAPCFLMAWPNISFAFACCFCRAARGCTVCPTYIFPLTKFVALYMIPCTVQSSRVMLRNLVTSLCDFSIGSSSCCCDPCSSIWKTDI